LSVTDQLLAQVNLTLDLATSRYKLALSSIIELGLNAIEPHTGPKRAIQCQIRVPDSEIRAELSDRVAALA